MFKSVPSFGEKVADNSVYREFRDLVKSIYGQKRVQPTSNDTFLVSYPRSGNTWVRLIISRILFPEFNISSLLDLDLLVPDIHKRTRYDHRSLSKECVIKSHFSKPFNPLGNSFPVIYIVRNPVDVAVSYFNYRLKNNNLTGRNDFGAFVKRFVNGSIFPCSWQEHVMSWIGSKHEGRVLVVKYEDMVKNTTDKIADIAHFLGEEVSLSRAKAIDKYASRENMVLLEREGSPTDEEHNHVRPKNEKREEEAHMTKKLAKKILLRSEYGLDAAGYENVERFMR